MAVFLSGSGSPVLKSKTICDQGCHGIGRELRRPAGGWLDVFSQTHMGQGEIKEEGLSILGYGMTPQVFLREMASCDYFWQFDVLIHDFLFH